MAATCYVGSFQMRTGTGTQTITGIPFQPKGVLLFSILATALDTFENAHFYFPLGMFDDSLNQLSTGHHTEDNDASADTGSYYNNDRAIYIGNSSPTVEIEADVTAITSDGFTLNYITNSIGANRYVMFLAIGGTGVSIKVGEVTAPTSNGNAAVTGVGFQPHGVLLISALFATGATAVSGLVGTRGPQFGWYNGSAQSYVGVFAADNVTPGPSYVCASSAVCCGLTLDSLVGAPPSPRASGVSLDSDGFTLNWVSTVAAKAAYMAIRGATVALGTITQPTSTGNQSVSIGGTPAGVLVLANGVTALSNNIAAGNAVVSAGAYDGTNVVSVFGGYSYLANPSKIATHASATKLLTLVSSINATGGSTTAAAQCSASFSGSDLVLNWTTVDATQRVIPYIAVTDGTATGTFPALSVAI